MRRNSSYHHPLIPYILFVVAIIYESLASMSLFLTPLFGVLFYYIIHHIYDPKRYVHFLLIVLFSLYVEFDRGLIPLTFVFFTIGFYKLLFRPIKQHIHCQACLSILYITIGYLGYYLLHLFLSTLFNLPTTNLLPYFLYYIPADIFLVLVFL